MVGRRGPPGGGGARRLPVVGAGEQESREPSLVRGPGTSAPRSPCHSLTISAGNLGARPPNDGAAHACTSAKRRWCKPSGRGCCGSDGSGVKPRRDLQPKRNDPGGTLIARARWPERGRPGAVARARWPERGGPGAVARVCVPRPGLESGRPPRQRSGYQQCLSMAGIRVVGGRRGPCSDLVTARAAAPAHDTVRLSPVVINPATPGPALPPLGRNRSAVLIGGMTQAPERPRGRRDRPSSGGASRSGGRADGLRCRAGSGGGAWNRRGSWSGRGSRSGGRAGSGSGAGSVGGSWSGSAARAIQSGRCGAPILAAARHGTPRRSRAAQRPPAAAGGR
jgi:hypothetical protein